MPPDLKQMSETLMSSLEALIAKRCEPMQKRIAELEARAPVPGPAGTPGEPGKSVGLEEVGALIVTEIEKRVALIPKAVDGRDGQPGSPGVPGRDGKDGTNGAAGKAGEKGADGLGIDDLSLALGDDGRTLKFVFMREGVVVKAAELVVPWPVDVGVYKPDRDYVKGDGVTFNGSFWIAQGETKDRPGTSGAWRLAVKSGRDGKDLNAAAPAQSGPMRLR